MAITSSSAVDVKAYIYDEHRLDLTPVMTLARQTYPWDGPTADKAAKSYRDFLWVCWNYDRGERDLAAIDVIADAVWHCHMLLPAKYRDDCAEIFGAGRLLDHLPKLPGNQLVQDGDEAAASAEYAKLHLDQPSVIRDQCVWAVVAGPH